MKNNKPQTLNYGWLQMNSDCKKIAKLIKETKVPIKNIYGIKRGGLIPAVVLSHLLDKKIILDVRQIKKTTLVVDDISDTGKTLIVLQKRFKSIPTATLFKSEQSKFIPTFYVNEVKKNIWVKFSWETLDSTG